MSRSAGIVLVLILLLSAWVSTATANEYKLGVSAAITGPVASVYAPTYEGLKVYLDRLNERGGIDGRKVNVVYLDNRAAPPRAVADVKRLVEDEKVSALINISTSATYAPMVAEARKRRLPLIFLGSAVCPPEVYPPKPDPYLFCTSFNMVGQDSEAIVHFLKELSGGAKVKAGLVAMDIPISRQGVDLIEKWGRERGFEIAGKVAVPVAPADYTPFATSFVNAGANWVTHWAPFTVGVAMFTSLSKLGWTGNYLAVASPQAEPDTVKFAQPNFYVMPSYTFAAEELPVFREIAEAARKYGATYTVDMLSLGWVGGLVMEEALKRCGWPCTPEKLRDSMEGLSVGTKGLYGGPVDWTSTNHVRSAAHYKVYRWDPGQKRLARIKDWVKIDIK